MKLDGQDVGRSGIQRSCGPVSVYMTVVGVYASSCFTRGKGRFFADLQAVLDSVLKDDVVIVVGDFNAGVDSSVKEINVPVWDKVRGFMEFRK